MEHQLKLEPGGWIGQYQIIKFLGRGGMGSVYQVEHRVLKQQYALKLLPEDFASRPEAVQRFEKEAQIMANLQHPHIVRVDEFGETQGRYWLRMEVVRGFGPEGATLGDYAGKRGPRLDQAEFIPLLKQVLEAVSHAHQRGVVHRDLKPANILLEKDGSGKVVVKVSDFGLARIIGEDLLHSHAEASVNQSMGEMKTLGAAPSMGALPTENGQQSPTPALLGTWEYMSPEQRRCREADARSDVYALGLMSFRLLTGEDLGMETASRLVAGLYPEWDAFLGKALKQHADARYANAGEMLVAFANVERALAAKSGGVKSDLPKPALPSTPAPKPPTRRFKGLATAAAGLVFLAAIIGGWKWLDQSKPGPPGPVPAPEPSTGQADRPTGSAKPEERQPGNPKPAASSGSAAKAAPWTNSLGMPFVPVPGTKLLFGVWDVRVKDYAAYAAANSGVDESWKNPGFEQADTHPVVKVSWDDANAFCRWLTDKERQAKLLKPGQRYRLPTDREWSVAVGLDEPSGGSPKDLDAGAKNVYPWGTQWPPPRGTGNYGSSLDVDDYSNTSPVGTFGPNRFALCDMSGNVWQWCQDWYDSNQKTRVLRGGSWGDYVAPNLLSSSRNSNAPDYRFGDLGFRCVLANDEPAR